MIWIKKKCYAPCAIFYDAFNQVLILKFDDGEFLWWFSLLFLFQPLKENKFVINKSRYDSIDSYLSPCYRCCNDLDLVYDHDIYKELIEASKKSIYYLGHAWTCLGLFLLLDLDYTCSVSVSFLFLVTDIDVHKM